MKKPKIQIEGTSEDRRRKLTDDQREEIAENKGNLYQRELAEAYGVSRRTIQFIQQPEKLEENRAKAKARKKGTPYYDKKKNPQAMKRYREHQKELKFGPCEVPTKEEFLEEFTFNWIGEDSDVEVEVWFDMYFNWRKGRYTIKVNGKLEEGGHYLSHAGMSKKIAILTKKYGLVLIK